MLEEDFLGLEVLNNNHFSVGTSRTLSYININYSAGDQLVCKDFNY